jgi:hypothetical protein
MFVKGSFATIQRNIYTVRFNENSNEINFVLL